MSAICSGWSYCVVGWGGNARVSKKNRIDKLNKRAGNMAGPTITMDRVHYDLSKMTTKIMQDSGHPLHTCLGNKVMVHDTY